MAGGCRWKFLHGHGSRTGLGDARLPASAPPDRAFHNVVPADVSGLDLDSSKTAVADKASEQNHSAC